MYRVFVVPVSPPWWEDLGLLPDNDHYLHQHSLHSIVGIKGNFTNTPSHQHSLHSILGIKGNFINTSCTPFLARPSQMTNRAGKLLNVLKPQIMCVIDLSALPLARKSKFISSILPLPAPCLQVCICSRAGSESLHLLDKLKCWSAKCHSARCSDVTTIKENAVIVKKSFFHSLIFKKVCERSQNCLLLLKSVAAPTDTKPHTISKLSPKTQANKTRTSLHRWK